MQPVSATCDEQREHGHDRGIVAEQPGRDAIAPGARILAGRGRGRRLEHGRHGVLERLDVEGLDEEVARARVHRLHGVGDLGAAAHGDDGRSGRERARGVQDLEAVHPRHPDVRQDHVEAFLLQLGIAARAVRRHDLVPGGTEDPPEAPEERVFVVAEEDLAHP